ncbi:MAG: RNA polymerase-associated protein RapA [Candidatus Methylacidiphilales bacterium]
MNGARPGQRWRSLAEPELGLGLLMEADRRVLRMFFPSSEETRVYSAESAPVERVVFRSGDSVVGPGGPFVVVSVEEREGCFHYFDGSQWIPESELAEAADAVSVERRLLEGRVDEEAVCRLRRAALRHRAMMARHPARGLVGPKCDLLPHQLYVVTQVADRRRPRALLADEVGLGKTIEAGWIVHRRHLQGRLGRTLFLVPESLVHQWFIELYRRFNLTCTLYDETRCVAAGSEVFRDAHLIIAPLSLFTQNRERLTQALAVDWGMVVIDEAHHLRWSPHPEKVSPEYRVAEAFARVSPGLLLLTGTPEQFGAQAHFARLRLLDPERFQTWEAFQEEAKRYRKLADDLGPLLAGKRLEPKQRKALAKWLANRVDGGELLPSEDAPLEAWTPLIADLLDRWGTGRAVFRNTRAAVRGFPKRKLHPAPLDSKEGETDWAEIAAQELAAERAPEKNRPPKITPKDPRVLWLAKLLNRKAEEKFLVICRTRRAAESLLEALVRHTRAPAVLFHEDLTLIQRDRNAAAFSRPPPDGARVLICSEIGSEGRNFQFAHHLVLFDLPLDPELLEQRIGRLDRIGQRETIHLHVPYFKGTGGEVLFRWFHEGIGAFTETVPAGSIFQETYGERLCQLLKHPEAAAVDRLVAETASFRRTLVKDLEKGRDRLLEWSSCRVDRVVPLIASIRELDHSKNLDEFLMDALDHFGVQVEKLGIREGPGGNADRNWLLKPGHLKAEALSGIPPEGRMVTLERSVALDRDDLDFLTWDHPLVVSLIDLLLFEKAGQVGFVEAAASLPPGLYSDWIFVVEATAPARMAAGRFLPPSPIRVVLNQTGEPLESEETARLDSVPVKDAPRHALQGQAEVLRPLLKDWQEAAVAQAESLAVEERKTAVERMEHLLGAEIARLKTLAPTDPDARVEVTLLEEERETLRTALGESGLRLDSIRLIRIKP